MRTTTMTRFLTAALLTAAALPAADDVVLRAMKDELARSMKKLQLENLQKPYFIAYREIETETCTVTASFGAIVGSSCQVTPGRPLNRNIGVEVRVGDYARDNTNFYAVNLGAAGVARFVSVGGSNIPLDDNYDEIRRQLWVATDSAYKNALDVYAKKKAALEHRTRTDDAPDFSHEPVVTGAETAPAIPWRQSAIEADAKALSTLFRSYSHIEHSEVRFTGGNYLTRYVNSEGTTFTRQYSTVQLAAYAFTQAVDGMPLTDFEAAFGRALADLPSRDEMSKRVQTLAARLEKLRSAPLVERYTGPVLFDGPAAAELVMQALGQAVVGMPRLVVEDSRFERIFASDGDWADKIGARVLPADFSLIDDASRRSYNGKSLLGAYEFDDEGVKPRPFTIVDKGYLKGLLHSRALLPNTTESTGSRRGNGPIPSNLLLSTDKGIPADQLKARLIEMIKQRGKEYGLLVRRLDNTMLGMQTVGRGTVIVMTNRGGGAVDVTAPIEAYKVYPDGREELVRNLTVSGMTLANFKDIVAASDTPTVYTAPFRMRRVNPSIGPSVMMVMTPTFVSVATPALLFEDLLLQRPTGEIPNLPVTPHPSFEK